MNFLANATQFISQAISQSHAEPTLYIRNYWFKSDITILESLTCGQEKLKGMKIYASNMSFMEFKIMQELPSS